MSDLDIWMSVAARNTIYLHLQSYHSHQRMNAVRMRKENQVISAEEKRLLLTHASEQRLKRENEIISGFRDILSERQKK